MVVGLSLIPCAEDNLLSCLPAFLLIITREKEVLLKLERGKMKRTRVSELEKQLEFT